MSFKQGICAPQRTLTSLEKHWEMAPEPSTLEKCWEMAPEPSTLEKCWEMAPEPSTLEKCWEMAPEPSTLEKCWEMAPEPPTLEKSPPKNSSSNNTTIQTQYSKEENNPRVSFTSQSGLLAAPSPALLHPDDSALAPL
uniref:Uncharacterized protein n=1 Tax=Serinus canaria TaxID=9135 RepID=A0A8C9MW85_SERCA